MKCPKCGGTGEMQICEMGFIGKDECDKCHGKGYLNNDEWRKTCSAEEFAEWIVRIVDCEFCPVKQPCKKQIERWLKQPHKPISRGQERSRKW